MNQRGLKAVSLVLAAAITCASVLSGCAKSNGTQSTAASPASSEAAQTDQQVVSGPFTGPDAAGVKGKKPSRRPARRGKNRLPA